MNIGGVAGSAVRIRKRPETQSAFMGPRDVMVEFRQPDGTWIELRFITHARIVIKPDEMPMVEIGVLLNDLGLELADPEQVLLVDGLTKRLEGNALTRWMRRMRHRLSQ